MDFFKIQEERIVRGRAGKQEVTAIDIYPDFQPVRSKDLMVRGGRFLAVWNEKTGLWSQDEYDIVPIVDNELYAYRDALRQTKVYEEIPIKVRTMVSSRSKTWHDYKRWLSSLPDNYKKLDEKLAFMNSEVRKEDYVSKRLNYSLGPGDYSAWDKLVSTLYDPNERQKIEWAIGAIVSGDSRSIQKFFVFYGNPGSGKGTILDIIGGTDTTEGLFGGYAASFKAKDLGSSSKQFATEMFRSNPLVAIDTDGDLSKIEDNTTLNSLVSHESIVINEKGKPQYSSRIKCFLFIASNAPVKITDSKSGITRRLIDIFPSGRLIPTREYDVLKSQIEFQYGAIAQHCLEVYRSLGKDYYKNYKPVDMIAKTNVFYNYISDRRDLFEKADGITLKEAYKEYKDYCDDTLVERKLQRHVFKEELKSYFRRFDEIGRVDGQLIRSWYSGFRKEKLEPPVLKREEKPLPLVLDCTESLLDKVLADCPAQYSTEGEREKPITSWNRCETTLKDLDTTKLHYILPRFEKGHLPIVMIDFDLKNEKGEKDMLLNLEAASKWPVTYGEFSKSGVAIHLIYWYAGNISKLKSEFGPGIEVKAFRGNSSMRRRLTKCNNVPIATLQEGALPVKEEADKMLDEHKLKDQQHIVNRIKKALRKGDNVGGTKCEIDLIMKTLNDAYNEGISYDVSDLQHDVLIFAMGSTHNSEYCIEQVNRMKFKSKDREEEEAARETVSDELQNSKPIVFFDIEIYPPGIDDDGENNEGLFLICWKEAGDKFEVHPIINPSPDEVERFVKSYRLIGFNNRSYDNHILYARILGYSTERIYDLSRRLIVEKANDAKFREAYDISYTDVFDFASKKQNLKKWEIELGISHVEMGLPWDKPAPKRYWPIIIDYCSNDVKATEAVFNNRSEDWRARQILADLAGGKVNDTTNSLTLKIVFGNDRKPELVYTDLATGEQSYGR